MKMINKFAIAILIIACAFIGQTNHKEVSYMNITAQQAKEIMDTEEGYIILDVRTEEEYAEGHIPGAKNLDVTNEAEFLKGVDKLDKDNTIYIYCRSGRRSRTAAKHLVDRGFNVVDLKGGYSAWESTFNK